MTLRAAWHVIPMLLLGWVLIGCDDSERTRQVAYDDTKRYEWRLAMSWPRDLPGLTTGVARLVADIEAMSGGRMRIEVIASGELVAADEVFEAVAAGTVEMGHTSALFAESVVPAAIFFAGIPFGMTADEMYGWLHRGGGLQLWRELCEQWGVMPFSAGNTGPLTAGWFNREIDSLASFRGLRVPMSGLGAAVLERLGAEVLDLPLEQRLPALQSGAVDAAGSGGPYTDTALLPGQVGTYYYYTGWQQSSHSLSLLVNRRAWEALPTDLQAIIAEATNALNQSMLDEFNARNNSALAALRDLGADIRPLPDAVLRGLYQQSRQLMDERAAADADFARVYKSYQAFMQLASAYFSIAEDAYIQVRTEQQEQQR